MRMAMAIKNVRTLTRPINIIKIRITLPQTVISAVMPVDRPTVARADVTSNKMRMKEKFSVRHKIMVATTIKEAATQKIARALMMRPCSRRLLNKITSSLPRIIELTVAKMIAMVVVLTPPPVEPGEAPQNIKMMMKNRLASYSAPVFIKV